jgi:hypothetical protein
MQETSTNPASRAASIETDESTVKEMVNTRRQEEPRSNRSSFEETRQGLQWLAAEKSRGTTEPSGALLFVQCDKEAMLIFVASQRDTSTLARNQRLHFQAKANASRSVPADKAQSNCDMALPEP